MNGLTINNRDLEQHKEGVNGLDISNRELGESWSSRLERPAFGLAMEEPDEQ